MMSVLPGIGEARPVAASEAIVASPVIMAAHMLKIIIQRVRRKSASGDSGSFVLFMKTTLRGIGGPYSFGEPLHFANGTGLLA